MILLTATILAAVCASFVKGHGFFFSPIPGSSSAGLIRGIKQININIDNLRNPLAAPSVCRGENTPSPVSPITLVNGQPFSISIAFSIGAQHIGPCYVEILDARNLAVPGVQIGSDPNCARPPAVAQNFASKTIPASQQCPGQVPPGLVTDDMCLQIWTFTVSNADKVTCGGNCVMRWVWEGEHNSITNPEMYENCADVSVLGQQAGSPPSSSTTTTTTILPTNIATTTTAMISAIATTTNSATTSSSILLSISTTASTTSSQLSSQTPTPPASVTHSPVTTATTPSNAILSLTSTTAIITPFPSTSMILSQVATATTATRTSVSYDHPYYTDDDSGSNDEDENDLNEESKNDESPMTYRLRKHRQHQRHHHHDHHFGHRFVRTRRHRHHHHHDYKTSSPTPTPTS